MRPINSDPADDANPIAAIRAYPMVVVAIAAAFGLIGAAYASSQTSVFSASAVIVVEDPRPSVSLTGRRSDAERYVANQVAILESRPVAERASERATSLEPPYEISIEEFLDYISIRANSESDFLRISFEAASAAEAQAGANALGWAYEEEPSL